MFILIRKSRTSENFWDFKQLKVPQNPLEPAKFIFLKQKFVTIDLIFLTFESVFEASKSTKYYFYERKSRTSEDFFDFGQFKVPFKVTSFKCFGSI